MSLTVSDLTNNFGFTPVTKTIHGNIGINGVYIGDLLSRVMSRAPKGCAWITICGHPNIAAVALLAGIGCIIIAENAEIAEDTIKEAGKENIPILTTALTAYEAAGLLRDALKQYNSCKGN